METSPHTLVVLGRPHRAAPASAGAFVPGDTTNRWSGKWPTLVSPSRLVPEALGEPLSVGAPSPPLAPHPWVLRLFPDPFSLFNCTGACTGALSFCSPCCICKLPSSWRTSLPWVGHSSFLGTCLTSRHVSKSQDKGKWEENWCLMEAPPPPSASPHGHSAAVRA